YVEVNTRGGGEYGQKWHEAGTLLKKQNVFDDFIAAAEYLIDEGYTSRKYLAIQGGSNGGLLVGAVVNQRPDLFAVAIPQSGVMDMLRYHKFTIGKFWVSDYGTSEDRKEMFECLYGYSPLHNVKEGKNYPAILVTAPEHNERVIPGHSFKYAATLQNTDIGDKPHLIRISSNTVKENEKPYEKTTNEAADIYSFILYNMGLDYKY
ncbi:MAG: S9 family peptidase, partial [Bacteroidales bacterium]|nr:S9 family peptidase [Bacteroidales bacterium]